MKKVLIFVLIIGAIGAYTTRANKIKSQKEIEVQKNINFINQKKAAIYKGKILKGMTHDEVIKAWGNPTDVHFNKNTTPTRIKLIYKTKKGFKSVDFEKQDELKVVNFID